jgi:HAD superfamily hydrolase (TIGR01509 family)
MLGRRSPKRRHPAELKATRHAPVRAHELVVRDLSSRATALRFSDWFQDIVISGEVKLAKPDPRIFELARTRCQLNPASTVYIDDAPRNVEAARNLGFQALHFREHCALRSELAALKVL